MVKVCEEKFEVWMYDKRNAQLVGIDTSYKEEDLAVSRKNELNKITANNEKYSWLTYVVVKQIKAIEF